MKKEDYAIMREDAIDFIGTVQKSSERITRKQIVEYLRIKYRGKESSIHSLVNYTLRMMCESKMLKRITTGEYAFTKNRK